MNSSKNPLGPKGSPEQLAAMAATLFFNITKEWELSDSYLVRFLEVSPLKLKSLQRKSAYFNEGQMVKVGTLLKIYNAVTDLVGETKESKGKKTKAFMYKSVEEVHGGILVQVMNQPGGLQKVVDFVETLVYQKE